MKLSIKKSIRQLKFKTNFLFNYLSRAPVSLAIERSLECKIFSKKISTSPVLDLGCGDGLFCSILFDEKVDVGLDIDKRELARASSLGVYKNLIQGSAENIPLESEECNTVFCNSALEHIKNYNSVLGEIHRILNSDGRLYITVPTNMFDKYSAVYTLLSLLKFKKLSEKYRVFFNKFWKHYNCFSKDEWKHIFFNSGFEVIEINEYASKRICIIENLLVVFAFPAFILKKITKRWIISERFRKIYIFPLYLVLRSILRKDSIEDGAGMVFFSLKKR